MRRTSEEALRLRMAARARLADPTRPPNFFIMFGTDDQAVRSAIIRHAGDPDRELVRGKNESFRQFQDRVCDSFALSGWPSFAFFETEPPPANVQTNDA